MNDALFAGSLLFAFVILFRLGKSATPETNVVGQGAAIAGTIVLARLLNLQLDRVIVGLVAWCAGGAVVAWLTGVLDLDKSAPSDERTFHRTGYGVIVGLIATAFFLSAITDATLVISPSSARWIVLAIIGVLGVYRLGEQVRPA
jgi:hypothetical protein